MHAKVTPPKDPHESTHGGASDDEWPGAREAQRDAIRPVRALSRGLALLAELNRLERAPIHTLANAVQLPRTTTFRILETLRLAGYVDRDPQDDSYCPTIMVRALSDGFDDEAMVAHIAKPHLAALGAQIAWPIEIAMPVGAAMMVRGTSQSSLAVEPRGSGGRLPMLASAAGRAFLAYSEAPQRDALVELLAHSASPEDRMARDRPQVERMLQETRVQGYGMSRRSRRLSEETSLALPLRARTRVIAALALRYPATALPLRSAVEQFLPKMRDVVGKIELEFAQMVDPSA
jgi:IclR family transcriptional regulator, mhp operon transcriptional activator